MNLKDIRAAVFSQADWGPKQSDDATERVDGFINRAYFQLALEAPFLFFEDTVHLATLPDKTGAATDTVSVLTAAKHTAGFVFGAGSGDRWCIQRDSAALTASDGWNVDGRWDSRMIELTDSADVVYRRRIRHVLTEDTRNLVTLMTPWHNLTDETMTYRIYTDAYYLPDDVIEVNSIRLHQAGQNFPLFVMGQLEAEKLSLKDLPSQVASGKPRTAIRAGHFQIDAPTLAPIVGDIGAKVSSGDRAVHSWVTGAAWVGPEHAGEFEYCYTYCWGRRDATYKTPGIRTQIGTTESAWQPGDSAVLPMFESSPSPSVKADTQNKGKAIELMFPSPHYLQGFGQDTDARFSKSGWYIRVYRRRISTDEPALAYTDEGPKNKAFSVGEFLPENTDEFFLVYEIPTTTSVDFTFIDDGSYLPDYYTRLHDIHGYQGLMFYPRPDARYEVDVRCVRRPQRLADDHDAPRIHVDSIDCLVYKTLGLLYEAQGDANMADRALSRYQECLFTLTKRYGDLRYPEEPILKRPARAHQKGGAFRRWYVLDDTPLPDGS